MRVGVEGRRDWGKAEDWDGAANGMGGEGATLICLIIAHRDSICTKARQTWYSSLHTLTAPPLPSPPTGWSTAYLVI